MRPPSKSPFGPQPFPMVIRNVMIGCGTASFWRGAWYILDDNLFPQDPALSAASSLVSGTAGMFLSQGLIKRYEVLVNHHTADQLLFRRSVYRFGAVYCAALSVVLVWRGAWLSWDCFYEGLHAKQAWHASKSSFLHHSVYDKMHVDDSNWVEVNATSAGHATKSGLISHLTAITLLLGMGTFASVLAPPAAVSILHDATIKSSVRAAAQTTTRKPTGGSASSSSSSNASQRSGPSPRRQRPQTTAMRYHFRATQRLAIPISRYRRER